MKNWFILFCLLLVVTACESVKILNVSNFSDSKLEIVVCPAIRVKDYLADSHFQVKQYVDSTVVELHPNNSFPLLVLFTEKGESDRLSVDDILIDRLCLRGDDWAVVANTREEIWELLEAPMTRYDKRKDKQRVKDNGKSLRNIIVR